MATAPLPPLPNPPAPLSKDFIASFAERLSNILAPPSSFKDRQVFFRRPQHLRAFTDSLMDQLCTALGLGIEAIVGWEHVLGGKLLTFHSPDSARTVLANPSVTVGPHLFKPEPPPQVFHGARVRISGLPPGTTSEQLVALGKLFGPEVLFGEVLRSRSGFPLDKGLLIFKTVPSILLHTRSFPLGHSSLVFQLADRGATCSACHMEGHKTEYCPVALGLTAPHLPEAPQGSVSLGLPSPYPAQPDPTPAAVSANPAKGGKIDKHAPLATAGSHQLGTHKGPSPAASADRLLAALSQAPDLTAAPLASTLAKKVNTQGTTHSPPPVGGKGKGSA